MVAEELLSMLWCPTCQAGELVPRVPKLEGEGAEELRCVACAATYPIHFGLPMLTPKEALTGAEWEEWREHLQKFQARRQARVDNPNEPINRLAEKSQPQSSFAKFTGIEEGRILDIGCGPGKFRHHFGPERVTYVGLDPMTLPEVSDFAFVQGIAENLPFKENSFTDVVVLAAIDHFRDLDRFLSETRRVLEPTGRLHIQQSVHEVRGPISATRVLVHKVKDTIEDWRTTDYDRSIPKHLWEFTSESLVGRLKSDFEVVAMKQYAATWYSPVKLFLTFSPVEEVSVV